MRILGYGPVTIGTSGCISQPRTLRQMVKQDGPGQRTVLFGTNREITERGNLYPRKWMAKAKPSPVGSNTGDYFHAALALAAKLRFAISLEGRRASLHSFEENTG